MMTDNTYIDKNTIINFFSKKINLFAIIPTIILVLGILYQFLKIIFYDNNLDLDLLVYFSYNNSINDVITILWFIFITIFGWIIWVTPWLFLIYGVQFFHIYIHEINSLHTLIYRTQYSKSITYSIFFIIMTIWVIFISEQNIFSYVYWIILASYIIIWIIIYLLCFVKKLYLFILYPLLIIYFIFIFIWLIKFPDNSKIGCTQLLNKTNYETFYENCYNIRYNNDNYVFLMNNNVIKLDEIKIFYKDSASLKKDVSLYSNLK